MASETEDLRPALRALPGAQRLLDGLAGEPGVYVVGGAVRDLLLGTEPRELDLVVEGDATAVARRAASRLGGRVVVHERFGTATVTAPGRSFDLAGARRERYPRPGALPDVELGATIEDDLARRDFTVNAMAVRLADGALVAWPGALDDLRARVLRVLHDRSFVDDPTRLLRLVRYAARLGFEIEPGTRALAAAATVTTVTVPRLGAELRLLAREPQPAAVLLLDDLGLGRAVVHDAFAVDGAVVERALALCPEDGRPDLAALAAGCLDVPVGELSLRLDALAVPAGDREAIVEAAGSARGLADALADPAVETPSSLWALLRRAHVETIALAGALADPAGVAAARRWLDEVRHVRLAITGDDLVAAGISGPAVGAGLEAALAARLDGVAAGADEQLAVALRAARGR